MLHSCVACLRYSVPLFGSFAHTRHSSQIWSGTNFCVNSYLSVELWLLLLLLLLLWLMLLLHLWRRVPVCGTMQTYYRKCNNGSLEKHLKKKWTKVEKYNKKNIFFFFIWTSLYVSFMKYVCFNLQKKKVKIKNKKCNSSCINCNFKWQQLFANDQMEIIQQFLFLSSFLYYLERFWA